MEISYDYYYLISSFVDSDDPGFLRIESVATLDPTAASQMFGEG